MTDTEPRPQLALLLLLGLLLILSNGQGTQTKPTAPRLLVLIVEETADRTQELADLLTSPTLRPRIETLGHLLRIVDQHAKDYDGQPARVLAPYRDLAKAGRSPPLPACLFVLPNGSVLAAAPLDSSEDALLERLAEHTDQGPPP